MVVLCFRVSELYRALKSFVFGIDVGAMVNGGVW